MPMGPAEIVASLKELCEEQGPRLSTRQLVDWIDLHGGYDSDAELIAFAKKMKARQYARLLTFEDEETGRKIKRLWSFPDPGTGRRCYSDICTWPVEKRREMIQRYIQFSDQLRTVRRAMTDYFAGQQFFDFYAGELEPQGAALSNEN